MHRLLDLRMHAWAIATRYERLIRDAGYRGIHYRRSANGRCAVLFETAVPFVVLDERSGEVLKGDAGSAIPPASAFRMQA
jgi:hypothetical protein